MIKDKIARQNGERELFGRQRDGLGVNTDIGAKLRALYGAVQEEGIPDRLLDLLEKLDAVESKDRDGAR